MDRNEPGDDRTRRALRRARWWTLDPIGSIIGLTFAILSVTPSLLPRPTNLQGGVRNELVTISV